MGNFALWIEQPLDMSVQRLHHCDLHEHRRTAARHQHQRLDCACHSGRSDSFFGRLVMWSAASRRVISFLPLGNDVGRCQSPRSPRKRWIRLSATLQVPKNGPDAGLAGSRSSAFCSLLDRYCHLFPLLSARQTGTHYSVWQFEMRIL